MSKLAVGSFTCSTAYKSDTLKFKVHFKGKRLKTLQNLLRVAVKHEPRSYYGYSYERMAATGGKKRPCGVVITY